MDMDFMKFISLRNTMYPGKGWHEHVQGWLDQADHLRSSGGFLLVRYEDLVSDTLSELQRIATFAGIEHTDASLRWSIERSTKTAMHKIEVEQGSGFFEKRYKSVGKYHDFVFVHDGISKVRDMTPSAEEYFNSYAGDMRRKLGYI